MVAVVPAPGVMLAIVTVLIFIVVTLLRGCVGDSTRISPTSHPVASLTVKLVVVLATKLLVRLALRLRGLPRITW
jgi:hypothetical protein